MITYNSEDIKLPKIQKRKTSSWIKAIAAKHNKKIGDIAYIFCDDEKILEVNREYLQHDYFTDIITFDYSENNTISGDIFISLDTVHSNAEEYNELFGRELNRVIIHGILHLCGQDDTSDILQEEMTKKEDEALLLLEDML